VAQPINCVGRINPQVAPTASSEQRNAKIGSNALSIRVFDNARASRMGRKWVTITVRNDESSRRSAPDRRDVLPHVRLVHT
jgi:hypothetical protein